MYSCGHFQSFAAAHDIDVKDRSVVRNEGQGSGIHAEYLSHVISRDKEEHAGEVEGKVTIQWW